MVPLFHGPEARDRAVNEGERVGRPIAEPMGDDGLSVETSREITLLALNPGVGDRPPSLVIGPLDKVKSSGASDALLKTIEEISRKPMRLILWAEDLTGVAPTIRSRCLDVWCPPGPRWLDPLDYRRDAARALRDAILTGDPVRILGCLEEEKDWVELAHALAKELASFTPEQLPIVAPVWAELRGVLGGQGGLLVLADALLPRRESA